MNTNSLNILLLFSSIYSAFCVDLFLRNDCGISVRFTHTKFHRDQDIVTQILHRRATSVISTVIINSWRLTVFRTMTYTCFVNVQLSLSSFPFDTYPKNEYSFYNYKQKLHASEITFRGIFLFAFTQAASSKKH